MYSESFISWAKEVMRTFALEAWRLVKITGNCLSAAWSQLRSQGGATLARVVAYIPEGVSGRKFRKLTGVRKSECAVVYSKS